jgi:hypothetical protein
MPMREVAKERLSTHPNSKTTAPSLFTSHISRLDGREGSTDRKKRWGKCGINGFNRIFSEKKLTMQT